MFRLFCAARAYAGPTREMKEENGPLATCFARQQNLVFAVSLNFPARLKNFLLVLWETVTPIAPLASHTQDTRGGVPSNDAAKGLRE